VLFDGICNFCNATVNFIIRHDRKKRFRFAPLQSEYGEQMRAKFGIGDDIDSIVLIERSVHADAGGHFKTEVGAATAFRRSTAVLKIALELGFPWSLAFAFIVIPTPIRDWFYNLFAKYRYRLFGRTDACMMPTPELKERFL